MTDIEWPEGATHRIDGDFKKWNDGIEFDLTWEKADTSWSLERYKESPHTLEIIERLKEPVINWDEQPTPEHVLMVDSHLKTKHWVKMGIGCWMNDTGLTWSLKTEGTLYSIHTKPPASKETEPYKPEVGEWFISSGGAKMAFVGIDSGNAYVCEIDGGGLTRLYDFAGCHPIKSEREQFIEKSLNINGAPKDWGEMFGMLYDNGARFTDE